MKRKLLCSSVLFSLVLNGQNITSPHWSDLFSYNNISHIREENGRLIATAENGLFYYSFSNGELTKLSKTNGLHQVKISAFDYNPTTNIGLIGYENGSLDVIAEGKVFYIVDIPISNSYTGTRKINHISINGNKAIISADYGVSIFNLDKREFEDTCFTGEKITEAVMHGNHIFAITPIGIKSHEINTEFPAYNTWNTTEAGNFSNIISNGQNIIYSTENQINFNGNIISLPNIKDLNINDDKVIVTNENSVSVFDFNGNKLGSQQFSTELNTGFFSNGKFFGGTKYSGVIDEQQKEIKPDGPFNNWAYKMRLSNDKILVSTGGRTGRYREFQLPHHLDLGFYYFNGNNWVYPSLFFNNLQKPTSGRDYYNVLDATFNPLNKDEFFICNYGWDYYGAYDGIYKFKLKDDDIVLEKRYTLGKLADVHYNVNVIGFATDDQNNLFSVANRFTYNPYTVNMTLLRYDNTNDSFSAKVNSSIGFPHQPFYADGLLIVPSTQNNNLVTIDLNHTPKNLDDDTYTLMQGIEAGFPTTSRGNVMVTKDKNDAIWLATQSGLRVLSNIHSLKTGKEKFKPIIIEENGLGEELLRDSHILQIAVDAGNYKWISVENNGVFYISPNGDRILYHFTTKNSPLPSDNITDIQINGKTGKVYFASENGIVSYLGNNVDTKDRTKFGNVLVYPNPVIYNQFKNDVTIKGLAEKTNIKITDTAGNLVHQAMARGGFYTWDLTNDYGQRVASGIYFVLMTNEDGSDTATAKIAVVN